MISRLTLFYALNPTSFVDSDFNWDDFDFGRWSAAEYEWEMDEWNGLKDTVSPVEQTIETGRGDCDDYSLVALSYLNSTTDHDLYVVLLCTKDIFPTGHIVTYDKTSETVHSSGDILDKDIEQYKRHSIYDYYILRSV